MRQVAFITSPAIWEYGHGPLHPLKPERLQRTHELLDGFGALQAPNVLVASPRAPTIEELSLFHSREYIEVVRSLSRGESHLAPHRYGFGTGDNPIFTGMFNSAGLKVGGALVAAEMLVDRQCDVAFNYSGGLHHAGPDFASGFCVFNDAAVAIHWLLKQGLRVAYVDIDVHHGDGVQDAFYETDQVLTISLHQSGRTLFPGTGFADEIGRDEGEGYSINVPLPPYTDDETYLWAYSQIVPPSVHRFHPDILVTQLGVDTHFLDPLANLALTTHAHGALFQSLNDLGYPWLALGGGGYNLDVVPRAWALAFAVMSEQSLPVELPTEYQDRYGGRWLEDREKPIIDDRIRLQVREQVEQVVEAVREGHQL